MNDAERWIYFDGPEPAHIRPLLDALRELPPATLPPPTPEQRERAVRAPGAPPLRGTTPRS
jgi:hypothetical protein